MLLARAAAIAALILAASAPAVARPGPRAPFPVPCAAGYHTDAGGNCQPNVAEVNRYCPRGTVFHAAFDGWTCDPPPPEAY